MATQQNTSPAHTAGPWAVHALPRTPTDTRAYIYGPKPEFDLASPTRIADVLEADCGTTEALANAELISKAWLIPELLASLRALIDAADEGEIFNHDHSGCDDCILCDARKVIEKAA